MQRRGGAKGRDVTENELSSIIVDAAIEVHRTLGGPGLLESIYEEALVYELEQRGLGVDPSRASPQRWPARERPGGPWPVAHARADTASETPKGRARSPAGNKQQPPPRARGLEKRPRASPRLRASRARRRRRRDGSGFFPRLAAPSPTDRDWGRRVAPKKRTSRPRGRATLARASRGTRSIALFFFLSLLVFLSWRRFFLPIGLHCLQRRIQVSNHTAAERSERLTLALSMARIGLAVP